MTKKVKKILAIIMALCALFAFTACGTATPAASPSAPASESNAALSAGESSAAPAAKEIVIGVMMKNNVDTYQRKLNDAVRAALDELKAAGKIAKYVELDGETDVQKQINQVDDLITMKVNAIIFAPAEANGCDPVVEKAKEAGVPLVVLNSKTNNTDELATSFVGSNDVDAGEIMGKFVMEKFPDGAKVFHLQGQPGNSAAIQRTEGIHNILDPVKDKYPVVKELTAEWQREKATKIMEDWLQMYGKDGIDAVVCDNDDMAVAATLVCQTAGITDKVLTIGIDAIDDALAMVSDGSQDATVLQDAKGQGSKGVEVAYKLASGETVDKSYMIPFVLITKDNVADYYKK